MEKLHIKHILDFYEKTYEEAKKTMDETKARAFAKNEAREAFIKFDE